MKSCHFKSIYHKGIFPARSLSVYITMPSGFGVKPGCCVRCDKPAFNQQCSICKNVLYCSTECQKKHWKKHKVSCEKKEALLSRKDVGLIAGKFFKANTAEKWEEIIIQKPFMEQMIWEGNDTYREKVLSIFSNAYRKVNLYGKPSNMHLRALIEVENRRAVVCKSIAEFHTSRGDNDNAIAQLSKAGSMFILAGFSCYHLGRYEDSRAYFSMANSTCMSSYSLGVESESMVGLGILTLEKKMVTILAGAEWEDGLTILRSGCFAASMVDDLSHRQHLFAIRNLLTYLVVEDYTLDAAEKVAFEYQALSREVSAYLNYMVLAEMQASLLTASIYQKRDQATEFDATMLQLFDRLCTMGPKDKAYARRFWIALSENRITLVGTPMESSMSLEVKQRWGEEQDALFIIAGIHPVPRIAVV